MRQYKSILASLFALALLVSLTSLHPPLARAADPILVTNYGDTVNACATTGTGACTLRDAVFYANATAGPDEINFTNNGVIFLTGPLPTFVDDLTIDGGAYQLAISGNSNGRIFGIDSGKVVVLNALHLVNGQCFNCDGGAILNAGDLTITNSAFSSNSATGNADFTSRMGGAIFSASGSTLTISNSTFDNNSVSQSGAAPTLYGGAIMTYGTLTVYNSTFASNSANVGGGGGGGGAGTGGAIAYNSPGSATLYNTILAGNSPNNCDDPLNSLNADTFNLSSDASCDNATQKTTSEIALGALADNGGPTQTMALGIDSVAIDAGDSTVCDGNPGANSLDQRGEARGDLQCDVGAFEFVDDDGETIVKSWATDNTSFTFGPTLAKILLVSGQPFTLSVNRELTAPINSPPANALPITWDATTKETEFELLPTLCYDPSVLTGQNENTLQVYHYNGTSWDDIGGILDTLTHDPFHCVTATTTLTSLSPLALAPAAPTAINVANFRGKLTKTGVVRVKWHTLNESFVLGFNVYRRVAKPGAGQKPWVQLNDEFLNTKQAGDPSGNRYRFTDRKVKRGRNYEYRLQVIYSDNHVEYTRNFQVRVP